MALPTVEQCMANRENALKSTGPVTEEGRFLVAQNAIRHGLSGPGLLLPSEEAARALELEGELRREHKPQTPTESLFLKQMAVYAVKADQARALQVEARGDRMERAESFWDDDRRREVLEIARKLHDDPERTVQNLLETKQGATWILGRWALLEVAIEKAGDWDEPQRMLALDLLGLPVEFRKTAPIPIDSADPVEQKQLRLKLARAERERLADLVERYFQNRDQIKRIRAAHGVESSSDKELRLLRRYERDAQRRHQWAWTEFNKLRRAAQEAESAVTKQSHSLAYEPDLPEEALPPPEYRFLERDDSDDDALESLDSEESDESNSTSPGPRGNRRYRKAMEAVRRQREKDASRLGLPHA